MLILTEPLDLAEQFQLNCAHNSLIFLREYFRSKLPFAVALLYIFWEQTERCRTFMEDIVKVNSLRPLEDYHKQLYIQRCIYLLNFNTNLKLFVIIAHKLFFIPRSPFY